MTVSSVPPDAGFSPRDAGFEAARAVADTVLFEGYMLYPYRANDTKNQVRWQFGVLAPPQFAALDASERAFAQTDCLLDGRASWLRVQVRFLQVQRRAVQARTGGAVSDVSDGGGPCRDCAAFSPVSALDVGDATYLPWDEAVVCERTVSFELAGANEQSVDITAPGGHDIQELTSPSGEVVGRLVRDRQPLTAKLSLRHDPLPGPYGASKLRLRLANRTSPPHAQHGFGDRVEALASSLVAAHLLFATDGAFVSMIDTPEWAAGYAAACQQIGSFPVLAGPAGDRSMMLASPIILYDHPALAPESTAQFCDATEIDELLTLRTLTLTDAEKRQARGSDPRAAALVDQVDQLPPELLDRLHGAIRSMSAVASKPATPLAARADDERGDEADGLDDADPVVMVDGLRIGRGSAVRLRPGSHRADAQDMFLLGRTARVEAVIDDVDGGRYVAVTLDALAELDERGQNPHGRFLYFAPDEIEALGAESNGVRR